MLNHKRAVESLFWNEISCVTSLNVVIIGCLDSAEAKRQLMLAIERNGMANDEYVYVIPRYYIDNRLVYLCTCW